MSYVGFFALLLIASAIISCVLAFYALTRRDVPSAPAFALMVAGEFVWAAGYLRELGADGFAAKIVWDNLQFLGVQLCGAGAILFALAYSGHEALARRLRGWLWIEPVVTTILVWSDPRHGLIRVNAGLDRTGGHPLLVYEFGPWFWVSSLYNLALVFAALALLIAFAARVGVGYRRAALTIVLGMSVPVAGALVTLSGLLPTLGLRNMDLSPLTFAGANLIIAWSLFRRRLLEVVPITRSQLIDQLADTVLVVDVSGFVVDCNHSAGRLLAARSDRLHGRPVGEVWPALARLLSPGSGAICPLELHADAATGKRVFEGTASQIHTPGGRLSGWLVVLRDVTEQRLAAELLSEREHFIRRITQASPDVIYVYDLIEKRLIYCNRTSVQLSGYGPELLIAMGNALLTQTVHPEDLPLFKSFGERITAAADDEVLSIEYRLQRADERFRWLSSRNVIFARDEHGRPLQILGVAQDITVQHQAAEVLVRAKDAAEAADQAKSAFLATMSHEIRTPLNAVIGMADLLLLADMPPELREYAATIRTGGHALLAIINNVLDLSKIGAGRVELEARPFDLPTCIEEALGLISHTAAAKGLALRSAIAASVPCEVIGDMTRVRQVLVNLLSNAVKFTDRGEIVVSASGAPGPNDLVAVAIVVQDTGIGVTAEQQAAIFQPFAQADSTTTRRYGGTGLGLAISRQLVELMGGRITLDSTPGVGSAFTVQLVLRPVQPAAKAGAGPLVAYRALVVEGDRAVREQVAAQLQRLGGTVYQATTGGEALAWGAGGGQCDLAIIGQHLGGLDSVTTARALRGLPGFAALPLLLLTGEQSHLNAVAGQLFAGSIRSGKLGGDLRAALTELLGDGAARSAGALSPLQVLIVEDNPINQQVTARLVRHLGHGVTIAPGGYAALAALDGQVYDVVLMDIQMPDLDGVETTKRIRALGGAIRQPWIVAVTASAMVGDRERYLEAGMNDYLGKPVQLAGLEAALRRGR